MVLINLVKVNRTEGGMNLFFNNALTEAETGKILNNDIKKGKSTNFQYNFIFFTTKREITRSNKYILSQVFLSLFVKASAKVRNGNMD